MEREDLLKLVLKEFGHGCYLFCRERSEQIEKHGFTPEQDSKYSENELIKAALFAINPDQFEWPYYWQEEFRDKIKTKPSSKERLAIAGALLAAKIDSVYPIPSNEN